MEDTKETKFSQEEMECKMKKKITIKEAIEIWNSYQSDPRSVISHQTIRNWSKKYGFFERKNPALPRSPILIDCAEFTKLAKNPEKYFNDKRG